MAERKTEADLVDQAVREATDLVTAGDTPTVAANWAAERHDLSHREEDIEQRVRENVEVDDGDD